jgi:hypothetical protein
MHSLLASSDLPSPPEPPVPALVGAMPLLAIAHSCAHDPMDVSERSACVLPSPR